MITCCLTYTIDPFKLDEFEEYGRRWMPLVTRPAATSHASLSADEREKAGISDRLIRLSVGIESPADLIADLEQALRGGSPA